MADKQSDLVQGTQRLQTARSSSKLNGKAPKIGRRRQKYYGRPNQQQGRKRAEQRNPRIGEGQVAAMAQDSGGHRRSMPYSANHSGRASGRCSESKSVRTRKLDEELTLLPGDGSRRRG